MTDLQLLTIDQVSELTTVPSKTLYKMIDAGTLPAIRFGRRIRVKRGTIEAFIQASEEGTPWPPEAREKVLSFTEKTAAGSRSHRR